MNKCESSFRRNVPMLCAMCKGNRKCLDLLVKVGVCVNVVDNRGASPLLLSAKNGYHSSVKSLIAAGACVNVVGVVDSNGYSPLLLSAKNGHASSVKLLIAAGADTETRQYYEETALITAAKKRHPECVAALIKAGADVNAVNYSKATALIETLDTGLVWKRKQAAKATDCATLLIEAKADIYHRDKIGRTALSLAVRNELEDIVDLIRRIETNKGQDDTQSSKAQEMCLKIMCRDFIRSRLLSVSPMNLIYKVERLKSTLPSLMCNFLLSKNALEYLDPF